MSVQSVTVDWLEADPGIGALVGDRLRAIYLPEPVQGESYSPALVYKVIPGTTHEPFIDGSYMEKASLGFFCAAEEYDVAWSISDALIARMYAAIGQNRQFKEILLADRFDDDTEDVRATGLFVVYVEFSIQIQ